MPGPVFLDGARVSLRTIETEDIDFLHEHINDPAVWRPIGRSRPFNREQEQAFFEEEISDDDAVHLLVTKGSTRLGTMSFDAFDPVSRTAELGYWLAPNHHGQGYGTEAVELMVEYGFDQLGLHRVSARVFAFNDASSRLLERVGFTREGTLRDAVFVDGGFHDTHWYGLLESEWRSEDETER